MSGLGNIINQRIENDDRAKQKVGTLPVKDRYFLCHCEKCGWLGSSEECRESINHMYGDGDYYCPACGANGPEEMGSAEATFNAMLAAAQKGEPAIPKGALAFSGQLHEVGSKWIHYAQSTSDSNDIAVAVWSAMREALDVEPVNQQMLNALRNIIKAYDECASNDDKSIADTLTEEMEREARYAIAAAAQKGE